jgi:hypothetical protein
MANLEKLPQGYFGCTWCGAGNRYLDAAFTLTPEVCFSCGLNPMPGEDPTKGGKVNPVQAAKSSRNKRGSSKEGKLSYDPIGKPIIGIDPGARYTGVVVRDGDAVLHSSTLVRPQDMSSGTEWALSVVAQIQEIMKDFPITMPIAVEGISDPKGFHQGKRAAINPKDIIRAGIVLGAVVAIFPKAIVVPPGNNGSMHYSNYPASIIGKRPADLPGSSQKAGTRGHEQSAYDVAGKASRIIYPKIDEINFG